MAYKELTQRSGMSWSHVLKETSSEEFILFTARSSRRNTSQPNGNPNQRRSVKTISLPELSRDEAMTIAFDRPFQSSIIDAALMPALADSNTNNTPTNIHVEPSSINQNNKQSSSTVSKPNRSSKPTQQVVNSRDGGVGRDQWVRSENKLSSLSEGRAVDVSYRNTYGDNLQGPAEVHLTTDYKREFSQEFCNKRSKLQQDRHTYPQQQEEEERSRAAASRQLGRIYGLLHNKLQREDYVVMRKSRRRNCYNPSGNYLPTILPKFNLNAVQSIHQVMHEEAQKPANSGNMHSDGDKTQNQRKINERIRCPPVTTSSRKSNTAQITANSKKKSIDSQKSHKSVESFNKIILITQGSSALTENSIPSRRGRRSPDSRADDKPMTASNSSKPPTSSLTYPKLPAPIKRKHVIGLRSMTYVPPNSASSSSAALAPTVIVATTTTTQPPSQSVADTTS